MIQNADVAVLLFLQNFLRYDWASKAMVFYTTMGNGGLLWIAVSLLLLCFKRTRRAGVLALLSMVLGLIFNNYILKNLVARPRPWLSVIGLLPLMEPPDPNSFPSGHTCAAFAAAGIWWHTLPRRWMKVTVMTAAALMGFSRVYVGVHYLTDVLAGMCIGLLCAYVVFSIYKRFKLRSKI